jgi:hypothetical protein
MTIRRLFIPLISLAVILLLLHSSATGSGQAATMSILEGIFTVVWGDGDPGSGKTQVNYYLTTDQNDVIHLAVDSDLLVNQGGLVNLDHRWVVVQGSGLGGQNHIQVHSISLLEGQDNAIQGVYGSQPWISIMCKFADISTEPRNLAYFQGMFSSVYPGLDHYWRELSYNLANVQGSGAAGWFTLPYPRSHYLPGGSLDLGAAASDCTAAANPYVNFAPYIGVNLMFNDVLDGYAWGGGWNLCLDGPCKFWRITWEPPWGYENVSVIAHEQGHGFGLPHSSGDYGQTYDNAWDVMSDSWAPCDRGGNDPTYGCIGQHTIAYHMNLLGWIQTSQLYTANPGTSQIITLERLALPQTSNYLAAFVPIPGSPGQFYTVEARQLVGYDAHNPGSAVIIHHVNPSWQNPAHVIDIDGNGNTGDAGAMWLPGETFTDSANNIQVTVLSATATGFVVRINSSFIPISSVQINGPSLGQTCTDYEFTAVVSPSNAPTPITYIWEADGQDTITQHTGGISDSIVYQWGELGTQTITVTASSEGTSVSSTHTIHINSYKPCLVLSGPQIGWMGTNLTFTATTTPLTTTLPLNYTWTVAGQTTVVHTTGLTDTSSYTWLTPGEYDLNVTATGQDGQASDSFSVLIIIERIFLPITYRH